MKSISHSRCALEVLPRDSFRHFPVRHCRNGSAFISLVTCQRKFCVHRPHSPAPSSRQPGCDDHSCTELIRYHPRHQSQTYSVHIVAQACDPCTREAEAGESRVGGQIGSHSEILSFLSTLLLPALARPGGPFSSSFSSHREGHRLDMYNCLR